MLHVKQNISKLLDSSKEKLDKCKLNAKLIKNEGKYENEKIIECLQIYEEDLFKTKEEGEYIFTGYIKNFSDLMKENNQKI